MAWTDERVATLKKNYGWKVLAQAKSPANWAKA